MTEPFAAAAPNLTAAPEPTPDPLGAGEAATLAEKLAREVASDLMGVKEKIERGLGPILAGQTRKKLIDLALEVVIEDGVGAVDLVEVVKAAKPKAPKEEPVTSTTSSAGKLGKPAGPKGGKA